MDNESKWNVIREIGIGGKYPKTDFDVYVSKLNHQFIHFRVPASIGKMTFRFLCVDQFEVLQCI